MQNIEILCQSALKYATQSADWAGIRYSSELTSTRVVRNEQPEHNSRALQAGVMCEVLINGHIGYAATADLSAEGLRAAFDRASANTRAASAHKVHDFSVAQRPAHQGGYQSLRQSSLDTLSVAQISDCLMRASAAMNCSAQIVTRVAQAMIIEYQSAYFSSSGAHILQDFNIVHLDLSATAVEGSESQTRSWLKSGQFGGEFFDADEFHRHGERCGREAVELLHAEDCPSGAMDVVLMPDQMILQIHESIGHPLELDRILGDERNYAGWSFVQPGDFGRLQYGSALMNVSFDPGIDHEMASYAFDDAGHRASKELLIEQGILKRGLGSLESQTRSGLPGVANFRASGWNRAPIDRMANLNLEPGDQTLEELIAQVEHGILMHTNRSWSIDDYRNKFQFGCEYGQMIENGKLGKVVKNPNYRGITVDFWNKLAGVGKTREVLGTPYCGKGEPNQVIRVGHASPPCLFHNVDVFGEQA